jgi:predicted transposase/invertase (TIGR01784 family)
MTRPKPKVSPKSLATQSRSKVLSKATKRSVKLKRARTSKKPRASHDAGYRQLFSHPELVRDLLSGFVKDPWLDQLDYSTLEKVPGQYVTDDLQHRAQDVVWRVKVGGEWVYLYILIEFQSTIDRYMALRMMVYTGLLYQDLQKRKELLPDGRLPPVLPIVLYNGAARWTAPENVSELIPAAPGVVAQFKPSMKYLLIDEGGYADSELASLQNLVAAIFRLEQPATRETITDAIQSMHRWINDQPQLRRTLIAWIRATFLRRNPYTAELAHVDTLEELSMSWNERMAQWAEADKAEGRQEGRQEGREDGVRLGSARALLKLLQKRFGPLAAT